MDDAEYERWHRDHQRKLIRLIDIVPAPSGTERVHALLVRLADAAGQIDISDYELAFLAGIRTTDEVRAALAALIEHRNITVLLDPGARRPGIAPCMATCPDCGELLQSIHRRALEVDLEEHVLMEHGYRSSIHLTTPTGGTRH